MRIAEFRHRTGLTRDAVRLYVKMGLLKPRVDPGNRYQHFGESEVERADLIRTSRLLGFSLGQMVPLAREYEAGKLDAKRRLAVLRQQRAMLDGQAAAIGAMRDYVRAKIAWMEAGETRGEPRFRGCLAGAPPRAPRRVPSRR